MSTKAIDLEHPDYLFSNYIYIDNIINYTIRTENNANSFTQETICAEAYMLEPNFFVDGTEIIVFNVEELKDRKYRVIETTAHASYDEAIIVELQGVRIYE